MRSLIFDHLRAELASMPAVRKAGKVTSITGGQIRVSGLHDVAAIGDRVSFEGENRGGGEVVEIDEDGVSVLPETSPDGFSISQMALLEGPIRLAPDVGWVGRVVDPTGLPLDGRPLLSGCDPRPLMGQAPSPTARRPLGTRISSGLALFDTLLPLVRGQRLGLFAGSGVGKSTLLGRLAVGVEADVVVVALIGERGREVQEFVHRVLGEEGMKKAVVVAATADQSPLLRRRCAYSAMTIAEYFRDKGQHVLLLADSITRFAEAHREIALVAGEGAAMRGFPPSTSQRIMTLAERAGPGTEAQSDITALFTVLVAGSDMEEPVADILRGVLDGHIVLDRKIAERGRFPAVDVLRSVSRSLPDAATADENALISAARAVLGAYEKSELMVRAGLYTKGNDKELDLALALWPQLDALFSERSRGSIEASFSRLAACLGAPESMAPNEQGSGG